MPHSQHALRRQILPDRDIYVHDVGRLSLMLREALDLLSKTWLQPPHWDHEPSAEDLDAEARMEEEAEDAEEDLLVVAGDIFEALTGRKVGISFGSSLEADPEDAYNPKLGIGQERDLLMNVD